MEEIDKVTEQASKPGKRRWRIVVVLCFLVAGVASILAIRVYLILTGYPQLGGGGLHIAHMLWGGLLMLVALILMLAFLGRRP